MIAFKPTKRLLVQALCTVLICSPVTWQPTAQADETETQTEETARRDQAGENIEQPSKQTESSEAKKQPVDLPFTLEIAAGIQYDDNVSVDELDTNTEVGDFAAVFDLDLGYEHNFDQGTELDLGYSLSQRAYFEETDFDLQIHTGSLNLKHNFEAVDVGASFYATHARLGGDGFLDILQYSPYVTHFLTDKIYLRGAYAYRDKSFDTNPGRDADVHALEADVYYFLDGVREYFVAGYRYENEDTIADQFDFDGHTFDVRYARRFSVGNKTLRLRADWRYEIRDYNSITPSIGQLRDDDRHRLRARLEYPLSDRFDLLFEYQYRNYSSNLPSADYTDNRVETQVRFTL